MTARPAQHRLCVFLTPEDEVQLSTAIRESLPSVMFVNMAECATTPTPTFRSSLSECEGWHVTCVDTRLVSESDFHRDYVVPHPSGQGWVYAVVGSGLVSLLRSRPEVDGLLNGELRATVPAGDDETDRYVRDLLALTRAGGVPVRGRDPVTGVVARRAERNFVAWPDAAARWGAPDVAGLNNGPTTRFTVGR
ncbi:MAG: hypothetical protein ACTJHU_04115 [Mycetocola sp.]